MERALVTQAQPVLLDTVSTTSHIPVSLAILTASANARKAERGNATQPAPLDTLSQPTTRARPVTRTVLGRATLVPVNATASASLATPLHQQPALVRPAIRTASATARPMARPNVTRPARRDTLSRRLKPARFATRIVARWGAHLPVRRLVFRGAATPPSARLPLSHARLARPIVRTAV
jgi:hypothetical protein